MTIEGLVTVRSCVDAATTAARAVAALADHGVTLIARIDHAAAAAAAGLPLGPTELLIFGNPRGGTPLMQVARTIAIDLPLRMLIWSDDRGSWASYDDPDWLARRHGIADNHPAVQRVAQVLAAIASAATETR